MVRAVGDLKIKLATVQNKMKPPTLTYKQKNLIWIWIFLLPTVVSFLAFYLWPIITLFYSSFTKWDGANPQVFIGFKNYITLFFNTPAFKVAMKNLALWVGLAATVHVAFSTLIALYLYRKPFGGRFVRIIYMVPNIIAPAAWGMIYYFFYQQDIGIVNTVIRWFIPDYAVPWLYQSPNAMIAVILTWIFYGVVGSLIVLGDLMAIPPELHEAARIDGASDWQITTRINLPLCRISIGTNMLLSINARIIMYELILFTTKGGPQTDTWSLPFILTGAIRNNQFGFANTVGVVMFLLGVAALLIINKVMRTSESVY